MPSATATDVGVLLPVLVDHAQLGQPAPAGEFGRDALEDRGRGGGRILRVHRQHQQPLHVVAAQPLERVRDRGIAVGHGEFDPHAVAAAFGEPPGQPLGERPRFDQQRRALRCPHLLVGVCAPLRTGAQDDAVQYQPPQRPRRLDDARVPEELREVAAHGRGRGLVGRAEVDEQDAEPGRRAMAVVGGAEVTGHRGAELHGMGRAPYRNCRALAPRGARRTAGAGSDSAGVSHGDVPASTRGNT